MDRDTRGRKVRKGFSTDSATENKPPLKLCVQR